MKFRESDRDFRIKERKRTFSISERATNEKVKSKLEKKIQTT